MVPSGATGVETFEIPAWPLVGREEELGYLRAARSRHTPASVVVSGLPGVGKSRLMQATLEEARADGWGVLLLSASAGLKNLPFAAFRSGVAPLQTTLKTYGQRADLSELAAVLEETIAGYRTPIGALLAIDDGHCLDDASAGFAHHLAATGSAVVLVTLRSGAERSDALTALWKDGLAERVELQGLSRLETRGSPTPSSAGPSTRRRSSGCGSSPMAIRFTCVRCSSPPPRQERCNGEGTSGVGVARSRPGHAFVSLSPSASVASSRASSPQSSYWQSPAFCRSVS